MAVTNSLRFLLSVMDVDVAVTKLRVVCKTITCVSAFTEIAILLFFLDIVEATAGLDTLRCRLREGCHCGRLPSYYRRARTQDYLACWTRTRHDFSLTCHSVHRARLGSHCRDERLGWVASRWQWISCSSSFVSKVLGANYNRANNFYPVAYKFAMCTDRK